MDFDICMASDDKYCIHMGICIISIMENNKQYFDTINLHILDNNISKDNKKKLNELMSNYENLNIYFYNVDDYFNNNNYKELISSKLKNGPFYKLLGISAYTRLFLGDILPKTIDKILYLDADTVVVDSLEELAALDIDEYYCAAVIATHGNNSKYYSKGKKYDIPFINSGVLLINLKKWRDTNFIKSTVDLVNSYSEPNFLNDQNIINILSEGKIYLLDPKYNAMSELYYVNYAKYITFNSYYDSVDKFCSTEKMKHDLENPVIVHFLSRVWDRPWIAPNKILKHRIRNPFNEKYHHYKSMSPWKDEPLEENNSSLKDKIYYEIVRKVVVYSPAFVLKFIYENIL